MAAQTNDFQLVRTKLNKPQKTANYVSRPRLFERLSRHQWRPITLVTAPAGYGKTTLVSAWIETWDGPNAWLSLDERDNDLTAFLNYFLAAIHSMFPKACTESALLLRAASLPPVPFIAGSFLNELNEIGQHFVLVLDDFHTIHEQSVHKLLAELLRYPPEGMHLTLITRHNPMLPVTRLRAKGAMTEVRAQDLRFTTSEVADLIQQMTEADIDETTAYLFAKKTDGWVTGLRLAILSARQRGSTDSLLAELKDSDHMLFDYLMSEVLLHQPLDIQDFLIRISILDRFCLSLCEAVTELYGPDQTRQVFQEVVTKVDLFMSTLDDGQQWFRYHDLFRQFLHKQLNQELGSDEIAMLHCKAADWFANNGLIEEALYHALTAGDNPRAVQLIAQHRHTMMNQDRWQLLTHWLGLFSEDVIETEPELLILNAWLKQVQWQLADLASDLDHLEYILAQSSCDEDANCQMQGEIDTLKAVRLVFSVDAGSALALLERAQVSLRRNQHFARGYAMILMGCAYQLTGDLDAAIALASDGLLEIPSNHLYQTRLLIMLSLVYWMEADLENLLMTATRCLEMSKADDITLGLSWGRYFQGCIQYQRNDLTAAERSFSAVVNRPYLSHGLANIHSACGLAMVFEAQGRPDQARQVAESTVDNMLQRNDTSQLRVAKAFQAELAARQGRMVEASEWALRMGVGLRHEALPGFFGPSLVVPKILLAQNTAASREQAADYLSKLREFVEAIHNKRFLIEVLALRALLYEAQGEQSAALEALEQAITLAYPGGFIRLFVDLGPKLEPLLTQLAQNGVTPAYIVQILAAFAGTEFQIDNSLESDTPHLTAHEPTPEIVYKLTNREVDVLQLLAERMTNKEIAQELGISTETVKRHSINLFRKLDTHNRRMAVALARKLGILPTK